MAGLIGKPVIAAAEDLLPKVPAWRMRDAPTPPTIQAWHGSGADFDRFDPAFIGRGAGGADYGLGFNFATERKWAEGYRDKAAANPLANYGSRYPGGRLYQVEIGADPSSFIEFRRSLRQQPEPVQQAVQNIIETMPRDEAKQFRALFHQATYDPADVDRWAQHGITGVTYQPGMGATRNYVVFGNQADKIRILGKYGLLPVAASGVAAAGLLGDPQAARAAASGPTATSSQVETAKADLRRQLFGMGAELPQGAAQIGARDPTLQDRVGGLLGDMGVPSSTASALVGSAGAGPSGPMAGGGLLDSFSPLGSLFAADEYLRGDLPAPLAAAAIVPGGKAVGRSVERAAAQGGRGLLGRLLGGAPEPIIAYKGSATAHDAFDPAFLGSGHSPPVYGPGHYFGPTEDMARYYRDAMMSREGRPPEDGSLYQVAIHARPDEFLDLSSGISPEGLGTVATVAGQSPGAARRLAREYGPLEKRVQVARTGGGRFQIQVDGRPYSVPYMTQGDAQKAVPDAIKNLRMDSFVRDEDIARLQRAGFVGTRHYDKFSAGLGQGMPNHVVFPGNEDRIQILRRYGLLPGAILGAGAAGYGLLGAPQEAQAGGLAGGGF